MLKDELINLIVSKYNLESIKRYYTYLISSKIEIIEKYIKDNNINV